MEVQAKTMEAVVDRARALAKKPGIHWSRIYREVLGLDGAFRRAFPDPAVRAELEESGKLDPIHKILADVRSDNRIDELQSSIMVRVPVSLHRAIRAEAHEKKTSMNQLCITKFLQPADVRLVPQEH
jgi:hypothetical protein